MNKLLASDRSKWLFLIGLVAITGGYSAKVLSHYFGSDCQPQEIAHAYNIAVDSKDLICMDRPPAPRDCYVHDRPGGAKKPNKR